MRPSQLVLPKYSHEIRTVEQDFVEITLGRASAQCKHLGICKIKGIHPKNFKKLVWQSSFSLNRVFALASYKEDAYFELHFLRSAINKAVYKKYFEQGVFKMEEPYSLDQKILGQSIVIPKGLYYVNFSDTLISVRFSMSD